jgi:hypothetical protein
MWYDVDATLSHNCMINMILGNRSSGKTYGCQKRTIKNFLKDGSQFIYLRRYDTEFDGGKLDKFWDAVRVEFPDVQFDVKGRELLINDEVAGYAAALSTAKKLKSVPFPNVTIILFDEFLVEKGFIKYLPNEVECFLDFFETVARTRDNVTALLLSNALTVTNPYFLYFGIRLKNKQYQHIPRIIDGITYNNLLMVELVQNEEFIDMKSKTKFGLLTAGTRYGGYAVQNQFLLDSDTFVMKRTPGARYYCTLKYMGTSYGIWVDNGEGKMFLSEKIDPSNKLIYSLTNDDHEPNMILIKSANKSPFLKTFVEYYNLGIVYFETINLKNIGFEIIKMLGSGR